MFLSDMERKTLAITPPLFLSILFFHLRGAFGSSKTFHYLLLLSCLLLSSVNTLHNLAEYDDSCGSLGYNSAAWFHHFNGGDSSVTSVAQRSVCTSSEVFCFLSSENLSDSVVPFGFSGFNKSSSSSALISNNLSDVEWLSLKGQRKSMSLILYDDSKLVHFIGFQPLLGPIHKSPPFTGILYIGDTSYYKPLFQEMYGKTSGELSISVSCGENDFMVKKLCEGIGFSGESIEFLVSYQTKPSSSVMFRDLGLSSTSGVLLAVPMKATLPVLMLNLCKKTVFWMRTKKFSMAILLAAAALLLMFCLVSAQMTVIISHDDFNEIKKRNYNHVDIISVEKSSNNVQENCNITISPEMNSLLRSISEETLQVFNNNSKDNSNSRTSITTTRIISVSSQEASKAVNLTVKTANDKKRRRKKKKKGAVNGLTTPERSIEASSSHSGDSTPSSPLSPLISQPSEQPTSSPLQEAKKPANSPRSVLSHSATFPGPEVKLQRSERSSSLAPNVRAPGAKVSDEEESKKSRKEVKEEKTKEYKYDIWGDHLTGLNLMDRFKEVRAGKSSGFGEDECESFFVKGSPSFLADSHARFVSFYNQWG